MTTLPITRSAEKRAGEPCLADTGLPVARLLAHVGWAFEEEAKQHPGTPYALECVVKIATRAYCEDFPYISFAQAEAAIGYAVKQLFALALKRQEGVLFKAFPMEKPL